jgi:meso-butanediol dehydrogenase/(S,S)-butanediol dehydrogenase/diacetyl reductase
MGPFDGKIALITGGGTGIGKATAARIASRGGYVVVAGRRQGPLQETAAAVPERISYVQLDVADRSAQDRALATVIERHGQLDILINNAGTTTTGLFADHTIAEIDANITVNLTSAAVLISKALPHLIKTKGTIVNVSSAAAGYTGMPPGRLAVYAAAKAGLNHLTRVLATEFGAYGIRVNAVAPGLTDTEIAASAFADQSIIDYCVGITPLGRVGQPEDVAKVICFCASEEAAWVTGQVIDASGGYWLSS